MIELVWKILAALTPFAFLSRGFRQKIAQARTRVKAVEGLGKNGERGFTVNVQRLDGRNLVDAVTVGIAVGTLDKRGRFHKRAILRRQKAPDVAQARAWFEAFVPVPARAMQDDPAECLRPFVELVGEVYVFGTGIDGKKLATTRKAQQKRRGSARSAFPPIRL